MNTGKMLVAVLIAGVLLMSLATGAEARTHSEAKSLKKKIAVESSFEGIPSEKSTKGLVLPARNRQYLSDKAEVTPPETIKKFSGVKQGTAVRHNYPKEGSSYVTETVPVMKKGNRQYISSLEPPKQVKRMMV